MKRIFQTVDWAHTTSIYEVNVRQYTAEGTFRAFAKELPRLKDMGVEVIWFMPITPISVQNRKGLLGSYYACADYLTINPEFGTLSDFKAVVAEAQRLGLKVIIDWVANHTGWDHIWTKSNPDFYSKTDKGEFRPPFPEWEDTLQLDYSNPSLRKSMIDAMKYWLRECGLDGFRCDMAHLVPLDFWMEARAELDAVKPLFWLAETEDPNYHAAFDASYAWEFLHAMEKYWKKQIPVTGIDNVLHKYQEGFATNALRAFFTSNHDENSHSGSEYERMGDAAKPFAVLCSTWNAVPLIYSGQELPLVNKRLHFFEKDIIPWTGEYELHQLYKTLLLLRKKNPALRAGDPQVRTFRLETTENNTLFAFMRKYNDREVVVILNLSSRDNMRFQIKGRVVTGLYIDVFTGFTMEIEAENEFEMNKWGWLVLEK
jgi:glycosidase